MLSPSVQHREGLAASLLLPLHSTRSRKYKTRPSFIPNQRFCYCTNYTRYSDVTILVTFESVQYFEGLAYHTCISSLSNTFRGSKTPPTSLFSRPSKLSPRWCLPSFISTHVSSPHIRVTIAETQLTCVGLHRSAYPYSHEPPISIRIRSHWMPWRQRRGPAPNTTSSHSVPVVRLLRVPDTRSDRSHLMLLHQARRWNDYLPLRCLRLE